jgi:hypothetical protein
VFRRSAAARRHRGRQPHDLPRLVVKHTIKGRTGVPGTVLSSQGQGAGLSSPGAAGGLSAHTNSGPLRAGSVAYCVDSECSPVALAWLSAAVFATTRWMSRVLAARNFLNSRAHAHKG